MHAVVALPSATDARYVPAAHTVHTVSTDVL